jgi:xanthine dehydrogenase YagR molybdenum-binding subunit
VLSHENAPRLAPLDDAELAVFQLDAVAYRGQLVAAVVAETSEIARQAADLIAVRYEEQPHDVELRADRADLYKPEIVGPFYPPDTVSGDVEAALTQAAVSLDHTYTTPAEHNNPLEPHATTAIWSDEGVTVYDSNQGAHSILDAVATAFRLPPERVRVIAHYANDQAARQARPHPEADLRVGGLSRADHPADSAGR